MGGWVIVFTVCMFGQNWDWRFFTWFQESSSKFKFLFLHLTKIIIQKPSIVFSDFKNFHDIQGSYANFWQSFFWLCCTLDIVKVSLELFWYCSGIKFGQKTTFGYKITCKSWLMISRMRFFVHKLSLFLTLTGCFCRMTRAQKRILTGFF